MGPRRAATPNIVDRPRRRVGPGYKGFLPALSTRASLAERWYAGGNLAHRAQLFAAQRSAQTCDARGLRHFPSRPFDHNNPMLQRLDRRLTIKSTAEQLVTFQRDDLIAGLIAIPEPADTRHTPGGVAGAAQPPVPPATTAGSIVEESKAAAPGLQQAIPIAPSPPPSATTG